MRNTRSAELSAPGPVGVCRIDWTKRFDAKHESAAPNGRTANYNESAIDESDVAIRYAVVTRDRIVDAAEKTET